MSESATNSTTMMEVDSTTSIVHATSTTTTTSENEEVTIPPLIPIMMNQLPPVINQSPSTTPQATSASTSTLMTSAAIPITTTVTTHIPITPIMQQQLLQPQSLMMTSPPPLVAALVTTSTSPLAAPYKSVRSRQPKSTNMKLESKDDLRSMVTSAATPASTAASVASASTAAQNPDANGVNGQPYDRYFLTPMEGLVSNKPFSLELLLRLSHLTSRTSIPLQASLAIKVSARHMEKRTNTYKAVDQVWVNLTAPKEYEDEEKKVELKPVKPPPESVEGTPAAAVGVKPSQLSEAASSSSRTKVKGQTHSSGHPFGLSSVFSRSTRTCPPPQLKSASRQSKAEYDKSKDRTIGLVALRTKEPPSVKEPIQIPRGSSIRASLYFVGQQIFISYQSTVQNGRRGLLEQVTTKGGGCASRPQQRYILMQSGFGYTIHVPQVPREFRLEVTALQLRSWEWEVAPLKIHHLASSLPAYPVPPPRHRNSVEGANGAEVIEVSGGPQPSSNPRRRAATKRKRSWTVSKKRKSGGTSRKKKVKKEEEDDGDDEQSSSESELEEEDEDEGGSHAKKSASSTTPSSSTAVSVTISRKGGLKLPTRHGRSLSALLTAVEQSSPLKKPAAAAASSAKSQPRRRLLEMFPSVKSSPSMATPLMSSTSASPVPTATSTALLNPFRSSPILTPMPSGGITPAPSSSPSLATILESTCSMMNLAQSSKPRKKKQKVEVKNEAAIESTGALVVKPLKPKAKPRQKAKKMNAPSMPLVGMNPFSGGGSFHQQLLPPPNLFLATSPSPAPMSMDTFDSNSLLNSSVYSSMPTSSSMLMESTLPVSGSTASSSTAGFRPMFRLNDPSTMYGGCLYQSGGQRTHMHLQSDLLPSMSLSGSAWPSDHRSSSPPRLFQLTSSSSGTPMNSPSPPRHSLAPSALSSPHRQQHQSQQHSSSGAFSFIPGSGSSSIQAPPMSGSMSTHSFRSVLGSSTPPHGGSPFMADYSSPQPASLFNSASGGGILTHSNQGSHTPPSAMNLMEQADNMLAFNSPPPPTTTPIKSHLNARLPN